MGNNPVRATDPDGGTAVVDDITVNGDGIITNIVHNDQPHRVFMENGTQLEFNDALFDMSKLDNVSVGDQIIQFVSAGDFNYILSQAQLWKHGIAESQFSTPESRILQKYWGIAVGSGQHLDYFGWYGSLAGVADPSQADGSNLFMVFEGQNVMYNIMDAGNFTWGHSMALLDVSLFTARIGAHINENLSFRMKDSASDQQAIVNGYNYKFNIGKPINNESIFWNINSGTRVR